MLAMRLIGLQVDTKANGSAWAVKLKMRLLIIEGDFCACNALDWASS